MTTNEFKVSFLKRASVDLADNEKVSIWEPTRGGSLTVSDSSVHLSGKWRVSAIGNFLGGGLLGELLIKPFFLKDRSETVPFDAMERAVIHTKKKRTTFHIFQSRDQGMVEVHVFVADKNATPEIVKALKATVPSDLLKEETAA